MKVYSAAAAGNETAGCSGLSCVDFAGVSHFSEPNSTARYTNVGRKRERGRERDRKKSSVSSPHAGTHLPHLHLS